MQEIYSILKSWKREDWVGSFTTGGIQKYTKESYGLKHSIANRMTNVFIDTYLKIYITGSEIEVDSLVKAKDNVLSSLEVFRQNILSDRNWDDLRTNLRHQYGML